MSLTTSESASALESGAPTRTTSNRNAELPDPVAPPLPDEPLITIERSRSWSPVNLRELWAYRELLFFLTWRDIKVRYKQTMLGVLWVIIQPLVMMLIFTLLFGRLAGLAQWTGGIPYPIFAFAGLLPWTFFASAVTNSSNSLIGSTHLITKIYFPRMIIPAAAVAAALLDFALAFVILAALMIYYGIGVTWTILLLPALVALVTLFSLGVGVILSALNVKYRDVRHALPFVVQIWMFVSPVIYPTTMVPERWRWALGLNPMTGIIEGFRTALLGRAAVDWSLLAISAVVTLVLLICSAFAFRRMETSFADVI
jgi:lipopolysaccharide transport system permease protein